MPSALLVMFGAWIAVLAWVALVIQTNKKTHPKALFYLFFVELWERFSYYGMRALLVLYMTAKVMDGGLGYEDASAYGIYAAYGAMVYLSPIMGGMFADRFLGFRKAIAWGAILMAAGHFAMAIESETVFFLALALLILGNGFFKPNISSLIGRLYTEGDPRRDGAFTIFYMGINIGAFLTPLTCGTIGELYGWHYGFALAGIGMVVGWLIFAYACRSGALGDEGFAPADAASKKFLGIKGEKGVYLFSLLLLPVVYSLIIRNEIVDVLLTFVGLSAVFFMLFLSRGYDVVHRQRIWVIVTLLLFMTLFWTFFELAGSALNLFTLRHIDKTIMGFEVTTSSFQAVNPLFIMLFAPIFSWIWVKLGQKGLEPAAPLKFAIGLGLLASGYFVLFLGKASIANAMMPAIFLVLLYLLHTLGELAVSPVGLSMVTKLSPEKIVGFMMGFWFLSSSIAHQAGKHIANYTAVSEDTSPEQSLTIALDVFWNLGIVAAGAGVLLLVLSPMLSKWMHGIK